MEHRSAKNMEEKSLRRVSSLMKDIKFKLEVWIDYKNLKYFMKAQKLNRRQAYQILYISKFNFTLKYVPRTKKKNVNRLNRRLDQKIEVEIDNKNKKLIKE